MSFKHQSKGSDSSNYPLPSLCMTLSSANSSTKSLSLKNDDNSIIPDNKARRWDDSQFALELAEDDVTKKVSKDKNFRNKIIDSLRKWQRKISN